MIFAQFVPNTSSDQSELIRLDFNEVFNRNHPDLEMIRIRKSGGDKPEPESMLIHLE